MFIDTCNIAYINIIYMTSKDCSYYEWFLEVIQGRCCRMTSKHMLSVLQRMNTESEADKKIYGQWVSEYLECFDIDTPEIQNFLVEQMYRIPGKLTVSTLVTLIPRIQAMKTPNWHLVVAVCENLGTTQYHTIGNYDNVLETLFMRLVVDYHRPLTDMEMVAHVNSCYSILQTFRRANCPVYLHLTLEQKEKLTTRIRDFWKQLDRRTQQSFITYEGDRFIASLP